ncbi:MAG: hypothetical protein JWP35_4252 [Caulobacter sp.]|nr:hypothetical protein [Caulobacter sp.]
MRAQRRSEPAPNTPAPPRARRAKPKAAGADATPTESPALALQADLNARWDAGMGEINEPYPGLEYDTPRWSPRRTVVVAGGISLMLWLAIGMAIRAMVMG